MNKKQILAGTASVIMLASAALAFAQTATTTTTATSTATTMTPAPAPVPEPTPVPAPAPIPAPSPAPAPSPTPVPAPMPMPMRPRHDAKNAVQIGPEGNALIRGTVNAVGTNSITVSSWGGLWTINVSADTQMLPKSTSTQLAGIMTGDFVGVNGKIDTTQLWTVNAQAVRDVDAQQRTTMMQKQMRMQMKDAKEKTRQNIKQIRKTGKEQIKNIRQNIQDTRTQMMQNQNTTRGQNSQ